MGLWTWFKQSQSPRRTKRSSTYDAARAQRARGVTFLDYYVFYYEPGRSKPKQYFGPYDERAQAVDVVRTEMAVYGTPRNRYKIRQLNGEAFEQFWGSPPRREGVGR